MQADAVTVAIDAVAREPVDDAARFDRVRSGILAGSIKPSLRGIYAAAGASQQVATRYLSALEQSGMIERSGRGYAVRRARSDASMHDGLNPLQTHHHQENQ